MMKDWWYLFLRQVRSSRRMPAVLFLAIFQPIVWVVLFSQLFQSIASVPGFDEKSYITFLTPGIAVMTALFGAAYWEWDYLEICTLGCWTGFWQRP